MKTNFSGYVLAGGKSSRMGADKAFLKLDGETFIARAVGNLSKICPVKIVLNRSQTHFIEKLPADVPHIFDRFENRGAPGGIHAAFLDCETEYAVILAVDFPFVSSDILAKLAEIAQENADVSAIVPRQTDGRPQPLCAVYRVKTCLPPLEKLLDENDSASVRDMLELIFPRYIEQAELNTETDKNLFFNVNHRTDFDSL
jgi:molybdenum cofactor guanylyltransferase